MIHIMMATYNGEKYICEQIESILAQTYHEWKLFISDDGSNDHTIEIINKYQEMYPNKIFILESRNTFHNAKDNFSYLLKKIPEAEYYTFCDQDDIWYENKIDKAVKTIRNKKGPILYCSDCEVINEKDVVIKETYQNKRPVITLESQLVCGSMQGCSMLFNNELKKIIEREVNNAGTQMDDVIEQKIEEAGEQAERAMEKESNEQIMQIHEYSETVMESMKKTHDEIMFLYSMLNDKHTEMTSMTGDLQRLAADIRNLQENKSAKAGTSIRKPVAESHVAQQPVMKQNAVVQPMTETIDVQPEPEVQVNRFQEIQEPEQKTEKPEIADAQGMSNDMILKLYEQGLSKVEIAKQLGRGLGEVNLVIELYKGDENL